MLENTVINSCLQLFNRRNNNVALFFLEKQIFARILFFQFSSFQVLKRREDQVTANGGNCCFPLKRLIEQGYRHSLWMEMLFFFNFTPILFPYVALLKCIPQQSCSSPNYVVCYQRYVLNLLLEIYRISALRQVVKHDGGQEPAALAVITHSQAPEITINPKSCEQRDLVRYWGAMSIMRYNTAWPLRLCM